MWVYILQIYLQNYYHPCVCVCVCFFREFNSKTIYICSSESILMWFSSWMYKYTQKYYVYVRARQRMYVCVMRLFGGQGIIWI